jgi:MraZ protein
VSVPASFRTTLSLEENPSFMIYPSFTSAALECSRRSYLDKLVDSVEDLNPFASNKAAFAMSILSEAMEMTFDKEGRIIIPADFLDAAGITDKATFVGLGKTFHIMTPEFYKEMATENRKIALANRESFRLKTEEGE